MIEIKSFNEFSDYDKCRTLWNSEVGFMYPISVDLFNHHVTNSLYLYKNASFGAFLDNELVGFIIGKIFDNDLIPAYKNRGWISLFFVKRKARRSGIGTSLLEKSLDEFRKLNKEEVWIGQDIGNFFPGVPADFDNLTPTFLTKRGFEALGATHDLLMIKPFSTEVKNKTNYEYRYMKDSDIPSLREFMVKNFPGRWNFELEEYLEINKDLRCYFLALDNNKVIGFLKINTPSKYNYSYNITWKDRFDDLIGIGPLGVDKEYRGEGISREIFNNAFYSLHKEGHDNLFIDWTGLMEYYQTFNYEVWKCYNKFKIKLN